jgi:nucleotide-binding universal stress UspA family protein
MPILEFKQDTPEIKKQPAAISIKNLLYATDFSATSEAALPYATAICRRFGSTLHMAHVLSDTSLLIMTGGLDYVGFETLYQDTQTMAQERIKQIADRLGQIPYRTYLRHGEVWTNLSDIVANNRVDLIVVGTHGRGGLGKLVLGSVAEDILRHAPCPVLTVGPGVCGRAKLREFPGEGRELAPIELELRQILHATNFTAASLRVAQVAISLAAQFRARLTMMHVVEGDSRLGTPPEPIDDGVRELQEEISKAALAYAPEILTEFGSAWYCIVNKAAEREADLIVLGAHPADGTTHVPWSTVHRVVAQATCPVLTVHATANDNAAK